MNSTTTIIEKRSQPAKLIALGVLLAWLPAHAAPIPADLTITANISYDTGFATNNSGASLSGTMSTIIGGAETASGFTNGAVTGSNPLAGNLTDTGDGIAIRDVMASAINNASTKAGVDVRLSLGNTSVTATYDVVLLFDSNNHVDVSGTDAYVHSEFTVDENGSEKFFTDIESDVVNGDQLNGISQGTFGAPTTDSAAEILNITLGPGATVIIDGDWTMKLESLAANSGANGDFSGTMTVFFAGTKEADTDSDGFTDYEEAIAGTSSSNSNDFFRVNIDQQGSDVILTWPSLSNRAYSVFSRPNLLTGAWNPTETGLPATPPMNTYIVDPLSQFFYLTVEFPVH